MGPAVAMIPVEIPPCWEVLVLRTGISYISNQRVYIVLVVCDPVRVHVANQGRRKYVVPIMEVVIVVVSVSKICSIVTRDIARRRDDSSPCTYFNYQLC